MPKRGKPTARTRHLWWIGGAVVVVVLAVLIWMIVRRPEMQSNPTARNAMYSAPPAMQIDTNKAYTATISTARGDIVALLDAQAAPQTVNNFVFLARQGFYDGLTFHRVEPGFVIQGGDPLGLGSGGPGYTVPAEIGLSHIEGAIAMARKGDQVNPTRASSGSQFYITLAPQPNLDGNYTVFDQVVEGMGVVKCQGGCD